MKSTTRAALRQATVGLSRKMYHFCFSSFSCQDDRREGMAAFVEKRKANFKDN
jgi:enoyl-CoA hydratase/carnithine racemase